MNIEIKLSEWSPAASMTRKAQASAALDLNFRDLCYSVGKGKNGKEILHQISGAFRSGQLTAILGPSGAGKTSLMNILAGLKSSGVEGRVEVNGIERDFKTFRKQSAYITQKDHLLTNLTVDEYMVAASHLKLGNGVSNEEKQSTIELVMGTLGLLDSRRTRIACLSGGECKRLTIALELIDNPAILFLDEPTSGLDSAASLQCVTLMREIARSGRTVVATVHQPSSRLLALFDHLYIVADGSCIYQGSVGSLLPYFHTMDLHCPSYHNPADFAIDVASGEYGDVLPGLVDGIKNGRLIYQDGLAPLQAMPLFGYNYSFCDDGDDEADMLNRPSKKKEGKEEERLLYVSPFHTQVAVLFGRSWRTTWREKILTTLRFVLHLFVAILMGMIYWEIGEDSALVFNNCGLFFFTVIFILYAAMMPTVLTFTLERDVLIREHLNHWYSLKAYYLAKTLADIPLQIIFPAMYIAIIYFTSNQPVSLERFSMVLGVTIWLSLIGQGIGLFFGALFSPEVAAYFAPISSMPILLFSGLFLKLSAVPTYLSWINYLSFVRYTFEGYMLSIYGYDRSPLECSESYCYFRYPQKLVEYLDFGQISYLWCTVGLFFNFLLVRVSGYFALRFKLRHVR